MSTTSPRVEVGFLASAAFGDWLAQLADEEGRTIASTIETSLRKHAASIGFKPPPERVSDRRRRTARV